MYFDLHVRGWLDIAERSMIGMSVEQVQRDGDVVVLTPVWHRDCALMIKISVLSFLVWFDMLVYGMLYEILWFVFSTHVLHLNVDEVPLLAVVESKLILLWSESLVVVDQSLNLCTQ